MNNLKRTFSFRKDTGTKDAIPNLRIILDKLIEFTENYVSASHSHFCVGLTVTWEKLVEILQQIGADWRDRTLIHKFYVNQRMKKRVNGEKTKRCADK